MRGFHRWLAYLISLPFLVISVTGVILVLREPLDRSLVPGLYATTPGTPALDAVRDALTRQAPGRAPQLVRLSTGSDPFVIRLNGEPRREIFIDPGSLAVLGERDPQSAPVAFLLDLHRRLALGKPGDWLAGIAGILLVTTLGSGVWLWWRAPRRWRLGVRRAAFIHDLHRLLGVVGLPLMLLIACTGIGLAFPDATRFAFGQPLRSRAASAPGQSEPSSASWDALVATAEVSAPALIIFPRKPGDPVIVRNAAGMSARIDPATMRVIGRSTGRDLQGWIFALHTGEVLPGLGIPAWLLAGMAMITLLLTGWWLRIARFRRGRSARSPL